MSRTLSCAALLSLLPCAIGADGNRLVYLDENNPYHVHRDFPRLTTPQWVGEEGVEAVVVLAIDDMRGHEKWETFLRPILNRLKKIDGRAPVSIMTCKIEPKEPHLQTWLKEGLSIEVHTVDHPCPLLKGGDFDAAKSTVDRCIDLLNEIPGNRPVAYRMPCCDSLNTLSPRFFTHIFNERTPKGNFLEIDTSVFTVFTPDDPALPRDVFKDGGKDRFRAYLPLDRSFVNWVENYSYPYVINRLCWEFPCMVPSDWEGFHRQGRNNPITIRDWQAALDATVAKQGVFNLVFHPHGWCKAEQVIDLIDHAVTKHGKKVKFLTFREARDLLTKHALGGTPLRAADGSDNGVRLIDLNGDGFMDVVIGNDKVKQTRLWDAKKKRWTVSDTPVSLAGNNAVRFGILHEGGRPSLVLSSDQKRGSWYFDGESWIEDRARLDGLELDGKPILFASKNRDRGARFRDLDGDGRCELIVANDAQSAVFRRDAKQQKWVKLSYGLPDGVALVDAEGKDQGLRFVDLDEDGSDDLLFSNDKRYAVHLFGSMKTGWSRKGMSGKAGDAGSPPPIAVKGQDNGAWFHSRHLWVQNENTAHLMHHVEKRSFADLVAGVEPGPKSPKQSLKLMQPRPGFVVELVAAEPLVQSPIAFAWGPDGRFWVVEMGDYPLGTDGKGKPGGRVKFLEDTDGDGTYDKATTFLEGLPFPTGVMPWRKGVLVTAAPDILFAEDTDNDGKADSVKPLFSGFHEGNQQHRVNSLVWGLDNWIYGANGDSGGRIKSSKTGKTVEIYGRDFRFHPDDGRFDTQSGQTQFGRCRDDWGNWFGNNNSNPLWHFALDDFYLRRNPHLAPPVARLHVPEVPGAAPVYPVSRTLPRFNDLRMANHFTSACSPMIYRDDLFGPAFMGNAFISEPVHNLIHREVLTATGVTFRSRRAADEQQSEFLASRDNWFRPTMIQTGPDGAIWVADMYRHVIEHPQWIPADWQKRLDLRAGHEMGRIYRIFPEGKKPRAIPRLDKLDTEGLVAALDSPSGWQRDTAQQMLLWKKDPKAVPLLEKLAIKCPRPLAKLHALCTLEGMEAVSPELLERLFGNESPGIRRHVLRIAERRLTKVEQLGFATLILESESDPFVRMQLACTLGAWDDPAASKLLGRMAAREEDRYSLAAILSSVNEKNLPLVIEEVLTASKKQPPRAELIDQLLRLASAFKQPKAIVVLLDRVSALEEGKFARWQFVALSGLLDSLDGRNQSLASLEKNGGDAVKESLARVETLFAAARALAANEKAPVAERIPALSLLGRGLSKQADDVKQLAGLLTPQVPDELQRAAVAALGKLRDASIHDVLLHGWKGYSPGLRVAVLDVLLTKSDGAKALLTAIEKKDVLPADVDAVRAQRLLQHKTTSIRTRAEKLLAGSLNPDRQKVLEAHREVLTMKGDVERGRLLFVKHCASCHKLGGVGNDVGPDLASLADRSSQALLIAVLDPNRAVEARYQQYQAVTASGRTYQGVVTSETGTSVTLAGPDGKPIVILRQDLESLSSTGKSVMPDGLEKDVKPRDFADVFAFVQGAAPMPRRKEFPGNKPELVRPAGDGSLKLTAISAEIYGKSVVFEPGNSNLGWWSSQDDHAVWEVDVPKSGRYAVWLDFACDAKCAGNRFLFQSLDARLTGTVASTGKWENYKEANVGQIDLKAGRQRLTFRSDGRIDGALIDLRTIRLVPDGR